VKLYDTLSRRKREFKPAGDRVKMYVCGITPYAPTHIGHAMSYVVFDVLHRYLESKGYQVDYVQNFTDVDDKAIQRAQERGVPVEELVQEYIDDYLHVMDALNVLRADRYPRATEEIPRMIEVVQVLVEKGYAYAADGDVYFRVRRFESYGQLSGRNLDELMAGARIEVGERKEDPLDFALWKASKPGEPSWESPWGLGRPGWHIECSAMSTKYLGVTLDIHGGGQDLVFPHHENEIAQSEAYTGKHPFARFWMHNGLLQLGEEKMSKSLGNLVTVAEALERHSADAWRLFFLGSHYRSPLVYTEESLIATERGAERLRNALMETPDGGGVELECEEFRHRFIEAMDDDLNTPQAIAALFDLAREINRGRDEGMPVREAQEALQELGSVLGLTFQEGPQRGPQVEALVELGKEMAGPLRVAGEEELADDIEAGLAPEALSDGGRDAAVKVLADARERLREARRYELADRIRSHLAELGVLLEDTPQGPRWRYRPS
jgi:cysteinyl-tRNA synthetase